MAAAGLFLVMRYDESVDAAYLYLAGSISRGEAAGKTTYCECNLDILFDHSRRRELLGVELLCLSAKVPASLIDAFHEELLSTGEGSLPRLSMSGEITNDGALRVMLCDEPAVDTRRLCRGTTEGIRLLYGAGRLVGLEIARPRHLKDWDSLALSLRPTP